MSRKHSVEHFNLLFVRLGGLPRRPRYRRMEECIAQCERVNERKEEVGEKKGGLV